MSGSRELVASGDYDVEYYGFRQLPLGWHRHELKKPWKGLWLLSPTKRTDFIYCLQTTGLQHHDPVGEESHDQEPLLGGDNSTPP